MKETVMGVRVMGLASCGGFPAGNVSTVVRHLLFFVNNFAADA
jgi:hypothetical protein